MGPICWLSIKNIQNLTKLVVCQMISKEISKQFLICCVLTWFVIGRFYICSSGLFHWLLGNDRIMKFMDLLSALLAGCDGIPQSPVDSLHTGPVIA